MEEKGNNKAATEGTHVQQGSTFLVTALLHTVDEL